MHPIEQLRYVARVSGADASLLVEEAASALTTFADEPPALVSAVRRLLTRQPGIGPLWWMGSRLLAATDVREAAWDTVAQLRADRTDRELGHALDAGARVAIAGWPDKTVDGLCRRGDLDVLVLDIEGQGMGVMRRLDRAEVACEVVDADQAGAVVEASDLVVIEAAAVGESSAVVDLGGLLLASVARVTSTPIWLVCPVGRRLAEPYVQTMTERLAAADRVPWVRSVDVVGLGLVDRVVTTDGLVDLAALPAMDAPFAPELLTEAR